MCPSFLDCFPNIGVLVRVKRKKTFGGVLGAGIWFIWLERNRRIFNQCELSSSSVWNRIIFPTSLWGSSSGRSCSH